MKNNPVRKTKSKYHILGKDFDNLKDAADYFDVSISMMSAVFLQVKEPTELMAQMCGYRKIVDKKRTVRYERIE